MIVMSDREQLDSWCVIVNGKVEVRRRSSLLEHFQLGNKHVTLIDLELRFYDLVIGTVNFRIEH